MLGRLYFTEGNTSMFDIDFSPVLRFTVVSDVHYKDEHSVERERMADAIQTSYRLSDSEKYSSLDALYVVGDFADRGTEAQMRAFRKTLDDNLRENTVWNVSLASHEYFFDGEENARARFGEIFCQDADTHRVINGFHFISVSCTRGCHFDEPQRSFAKKALEEAVADDPKKPIFFFQHPHIEDTVYGSIAWGEDELTDILCNYPQIIDFSGHSHAPINDPRSIHQRHFTCLGTGTLSYFENDEFDKYYGTCFPGKEKAAQMLIVEADARGRVRVYPYDLITGNFFPFVWKIDEPWNPDSFLYTDARYKTLDAPYFEEGTEISAEVRDGVITVKFGQAKTDREYVNDYRIYIKTPDGLIVRNKNIWSEYYFYDMPDTLSVDFDDVKPGEYRVEIYAGSFWKTVSEKPLTFGIIKV